MRAYRLSTLALAVAAVGVAVLSAPAARAGGYFGVSGGNVDFELPQSAVRFEVDGTAYKAFGGFRFGEWLGVEAQYAMLDGLDSTFGEVAAEYDGDLVSAFLVGSLRISPRVELWAKAGGTAWDATVRVTSPDPDASYVSDDDGTAFSYGVGAAFLVTRRFGLRVEWETFGDLGDASDVKMISVGAQFGF